MEIDKVIKIIGILVVIWMVIKIIVYLEGIRNKPECYGDYTWNRKCKHCEFIYKCIELKNSRIAGTIYKYTNKHIPLPQKQGK